MDSSKENNHHDRGKDNAPEYSRVILTLKNCLLPDEKLSPTPSLLDGLDADTEAELRVLGCELIQTAGILLRLPQVAMATAQVLFQRFYFSKSFVRQNFEVTGMGCLYLASKIEEAPRRIRDVINVYHHIKQFNNKKKWTHVNVPNKWTYRIQDLKKTYGFISSKQLTPMILDQNYISLKYQVIKAERRVLKELGFCVHVKHPHKLIVLYMQVLGMESKHNLMQMAWNYMNDSLRTDVFVRFQPETIACACVYLSARKLKISLPKSPPWYSIFRVDEADIQDVCLRIMRLYTRKKPLADDLEKKIQELGRKFEESRLKNKAGLNNITSGNNTPNSPATNDKKHSPKRSRTRSRSRTLSDSPRRKRYKRSRSGSYDKYKKSRSRRSRSRSYSPAFKRDKRYRSRSRSFERDYHKSDKYSTDRYKDKEDRYYREDRFRRDDDRYRREDDKHKKDDDYKYNKKDDDYKYKKDDEKYRKDDEKYRKDDEKYRKDDRYKREERDNIKSRKEEESIKYKEKEDKYRIEEEANHKYKEEKTRKDEKVKEDSRKHKKDKTVEEEKKVKSKHSTSKHKVSGEKRKKKHNVVVVDDDDDDIRIVHVKKDDKKKIR